MRRKYGVQTTSQNMKVFIYQLVNMPWGLNQPQQQMLYTPS